MPQRRLYYVYVLLLSVSYIVVIANFLFSAYKLLGWVQIYSFGIVFPVILSYLYLVLLAFSILPSKSTRALALIFNPILASYWFYLNTGISLGFWQSIFDQFVIFFTIDSELEHWVFRVPFFFTVIFLIYECLPTRNSYKNIEIEVTSSWDEMASKIDIIKNQQTLDSNNSQEKKKTNNSCK